MQDAPSPPELLRAVAAFLRDELLPRLDGETAYKVRVAANAIDLVRREITAPREDAEHERTELQALLGIEGSTATLTQALARWIAAGGLDLDDRALQALLWRVTEAKLAVDQPGYAGLKRAHELRTARQER